MKPKPKSAKQIINKLAFDAATHGANPSNPKPSTDQALTELRDLVLSELPEKVEHEKYCDLNYKWVNEEDVNCSCVADPQNEIVLEITEAINKLFGGKE